MSSDIKINRGLRGVYFERSSISSIDGLKGELNYRGYSIDELAQYSTFEEVAFLLIYGELPNQKTLNNFEDNKNIISHGKLRLDPSQLECEWDGKQLPDKLTTTEFLIVKELAKRPGIIKERAQLMDIAYREDTDIEDRTIDSHVKRIRKKFKKVDPEFSAIETRYGSGYRWNVS